MILAIGFARCLDRNVRFFCVADCQQVLENVIEPALQRLSADQLEQPVASKDIFLEQLKKLLSDVVERLQERPVIVAHTENTFDGSGVRRLLANKFELDKVRDQS